MADIAEMYGEDWRSEDTIAALQRVHKAVDFAEHTSQEDFIQQVLPALDRFTVPELWALSGMLHWQRFGFLADFVGWYATHAEAMAAQAEREGEAQQVGRRINRHLRWYTPSPLHLWGEWSAEEAYRRGRREAREEHKQAAAPRPTPSALAAFIHDWHPEKPS